MAEPNKMATWQDTTPMGAGSKQVLADDIEAAKTGDPQAQYQLGFKYYLGASGAQDFNEAAKWYQLAAEQGHAEAQYKLAKMKANAIGIDRDYPEAAKWFGVAAEQRHAEALFSLGELHAQGHVEDASPQTAYMWHWLAHEQFDADLGAYLASENLDPSVRGPALAAAVGDAEFAADLEVGLDKAAAALHALEGTLGADEIRLAEQQGATWLAQHT